MFAKRFLSRRAPDVLQSMQEAEKLNDPEIITKSTILSKNLGNSSHYDNTDKSMSFAVWVEKNKDKNKAQNWYFVLPNVTDGNCNGVVIQLFHGAALSWDGRVLRHCTSVTTVHPDNAVYSGFICSK